MRRIKKQRNIIATGVLASLALGAGASAQTTDALLDKLVDKGILTVKEANELREETDKGFTQAYQVKSGMQDWVTSFKINGDLRGRYEQIKGFNKENFPAVSERNRFRYRLRVGATAVIKDNFEVGFRLTSSEPATSGNGNGGDPISGNTSFGNNGSKKFIYIDAAYGKWTPFNTREFSSTFTLGKMENPFVFSEMVFDPDYTPEGLAQQFSLSLGSKHSLKANFGEFVLAELANTQGDPYLFGGQLRWDANWTTKLQSTMGVGLLNITDASRLNGPAGAWVVPDQNRGNLRNRLTGGAAADQGAFQNNYNPVVIDAAVTYNLESFPCYTGAFPIKLTAEYMNNPAASQANEGYALGIMFGKSGKKNTWDLSYRYKVLEGDAWYEELVDSDFGAYYNLGVADTKPTRIPANAGVASAAGYYAGTNLRGHIFKASYSPFDQFTLGATYFLTEAIEEARRDSMLTGRLQIDATLKF